MRILGIDPGYAIVGFGVADYSGMNFAPVEYGAILTEAHTDFSQRLKCIADDMDYILEKFEPDCLSIEKLFFTNNQKTAIDVAQARGVIVLSAVRHGISIYEYTPLGRRVCTGRSCKDTGSRTGRYFKGDCTNL